MVRQQQSDLPHGGSCLQMDLALPSEVTAIEPSVDKPMLLIKKCRCAPENEIDIEIALREALENAVIHGNHEDPRKHVYVSCRCEAGEEVSIIVKDEGKDLTALRYRTLPPQRLLNPLTAVEST